jgi:hypothetical protein
VFRLIDSDFESIGNPLVHLREQLAVLGATEAMQKIWRAPTAWGERAQGRLWIRRPVSWNNRSTVNEVVSVARDD